MRHFMQGRPGIKSHLFRCQIQNAGTVHRRIDKHGQSPEDNDSRDGNSSFMWFAFYHRFSSQYGCRTANGTTRRGQQSQIPVHLHQPSDKQADKNRSRHDYRIDQDGRKPDCDHTLECQPETIQHDTGTQHLFRTEQYSRHPCLRQMVTQAVRIYHTQYDTDNQRAERKVLDKRKFRYIESRTREESYQQNTMKYVTPFFAKHNQLSLKSITFITGGKSKAFSRYPFLICFYRA